MGNYCYVAVCSAALGASASTEVGEGRGISWRPPAYSLSYTRTGYLYATHDADDVAVIPDITNRGVAIGYRAYTTPLDLFAGSARSVVLTFDNRIVHVNNPNRFENVRFYDCMPSGKKS